MLHKFKRHKPRKGFAVDELFKGLSTNKFSKNGRHLFTTHKYLSPYYGDDRFCNMLVQWNEAIHSKITSRKAKRLFPFYPSYVPLINAKTVVSKNDFYRISSGTEYNCMNCGTEIYSKWGERSIKNFLCSRCISIHFLSKDEQFHYSANIKSLYGDRFSKNILDFFKLEQENEKNILSKILERRKNYIKSISDPEERSRINGIYRRLKNSLPLQ